MEHAGAASDQEIAPRFAEAAAVVNAILSGTPGDCSPSWKPAPTPAPNGTGSSSASSTAGPRSPPTCPPSNGSSPYSALTADRPRQHPAPRPSTAQPPICAHRNGLYPPVNRPQLGGSGSWLWHQAGCWHDLLKPPAKTDPERPDQEERSFCPL